MSKRKEHEVIFVSVVIVGHIVLCMLCSQADALVQYLEEPLTQVAAS